jgi:hypothetical protein
MALPSPTTSGYVADGGELSVTVSAAMVTAISELTTAEDIVFNNVRSFRPVEQPERTTRSNRVTAGIIAGTSANKGHYVYDLILVDDEFLGAAGEHGTDLISSCQLLRLVKENEVALGGLTATPAGDSATHMTITLGGEIQVIMASDPDIDADAESEAERTFRITAESRTIAAHG